jgi:hypothetical protein
MFGKKYKKIEILFKGNDSNTNKDKIFVPTTKLTYDNAGMFITGDNLVIVIDIINEVDNSVSNEGWIYSLNELTAYKTYN